MWASNTAHPNKIVAEAIEAGKIPELSGYGDLRREVKYGTNSRIDILLSEDGKPDCYVEIKNVHLMRDTGVAEFPDSVSTRAAKHQGELANMVEQGARSVTVYLCQREDCDSFRLAADIDPDYARAVKDAKQGCGSDLLRVRVIQPPAEMKTLNSRRLECWNSITPTIAARRSGSPKKASTSKDTCSILGQRSNSTRKHPNQYVSNAGTLSHAQMDALLRKCRPAVCFPPAFLPRFDGLNEGPSRRLSARLQRVFPFKNIGNSSTRYRRPA